MVVTSGISVHQSLLLPQASSTLKNMTFKKHIQLPQLFSACILTFHDLINTDYPEEKVDVFFLTSNLL
jgi:hypothetical protein